MNNSNQQSAFSIQCLVTRLLIVTCLLSSSQALAQNNDYDSLIVKPKETLLKSRRVNHLLYRYGIPKARKVNEKVYVIPLSNNENKENKIQELKASDLFELVEPDYKISLDDLERHYTKVNLLPKKSLESDNTEAKEITPNDKGFSSQYYLRQINATKAWNITVGDSLLVGILDTGVNSKHPDLTGKISGGRNENNKDLSDDIGHGTEVAGIIAANTNNSQGIAGISWNTKILSVRITDENGQARVSQVVQGLDEAYSKGVKIVQISLSTNQFSQTLKDAIKEAKERGILIISTGGNTGIEELRFPAAFDGVIGVGAVDKTKDIESYSTRGEHISLVAPGSFIYTTSLSSYNETSGTSFAAPQIAGAAALVWSINPELTNNEVREILLNSADDLGQDGRDNEYGYGLLNIEKAVELAKGYDK